MNTDTVSKKKPLTYCEKYGHTWASSTSDGFELCTHVSYDTKGKPHPCKATRRHPDTVPLGKHVKRPLVQPLYHVPSTQQGSLFD